MCPLHPSLPPQVPQQGPYMERHLSQNFLPHISPQHMSPLPGFPARLPWKEVPISRAFFYLGSEQMFWFDMCKVMWVHRCKCILISYMKVNLQLCLLLQNSFDEFQVQKVEYQVGVTDRGAVLLIPRQQGHRGRSVSSAICTEWRC
jgi:hypothetical protein